MEEKEEEYVERRRQINSLVLRFNEEHVHSDHRPLVLDTNHFDGNMFNRSKVRVKQFEARWLKEETCMEVVKMAWKKAKMADVGPSLAARTRAVHADLHTWD